MPDVEKDEIKELEPVAVVGKKGKTAAKKVVKPKKEDSSRVFNLDVDLGTLMNALNDAENLLKDAQTQKSKVSRTNFIYNNIVLIVGIFLKGYIIQKREPRPSQVDGEADEFIELNEEYHPCLFAQHASKVYKEFDSFDAAVDEFYSTFESQKIDVKTMQQERDALKKLSNVKRDHEKRLDDLGKWQVFDKNKADLITRNQELVDNAILAIRSAIASQLPWPEIQNLVKSAQANKDRVATAIRQLKLEKNHISLYLTDPYITENDGDQYEDEDKLESTLIDIDLGLSAYANATRYYDQVKQKNNLITSRACKCPIFSIFCISFLYRPIFNLVLYFLLIFLIKIKMTFSSLKIHP